MPPPDEPSKSFTVGFEPSKKPTYAVNGAIGGASPGGTEIVAHLYCEYPALPIHLAYQGEDMGEGIVNVRLDSEERLTRNDITREVQATLCMSPEAALALGQFLTVQATAALETRRQRGG
jgi:hypothetical protein